MSNTPQDSTNPQDRLDALRWRAFSHALVTADEKLIDSIDVLMDGSDDQPMTLVGLNAGVDAYIAATGAGL